MWGHIRTIILVTIVAALVWTFAEADTLREQKAPVTLALRVPTGMPLTIESPTGGAPLTDISTEVTLEGPTAQLERVAPALREAVLLSPGMTGVPGVPGTYDVDIAQALRSLPLLAEAGVSVKGVDPPTVKVRVDELAQVELPVRIEGDGDFQGAPVVAPSKVMLYAPKGEAANLSASSSASVMIEAGALSRFVPGRAETLPGMKVQLPREIAASSRARLEPSRVDVTLTVRSRTAELIVPRVPVEVRLAPEDLSVWTIDIPEADRFLVDVKVIGAPDVLTQIQNRTLPLVATVALSYQELERAVTSPQGRVGGPGSSGVVEKEAVFSSLPTSLKFEVEDRVVRVRVGRR
ncbi:MAG: hypothetical protein U0637_10480 [Phycisphaerales bacterium]